MWSGGSCLVYPQIVIHDELKLAIWIEAGMQGYQLSGAHNLRSMTESGLLKERATILDGISAVIDTLPERRLNSTVS